MQREKKKLKSSANTKIVIIGHSMEGKTTELLFISTIFKRFPISP